MLNDMAEDKTFDPIEVLHALPNEAQQQAKYILSHATDVMDPAVSRQLRELFKKYEKELMAFGLLADYYAYALIYAWPIYMKSLTLDQGGPRAKDFFGPGSNN